MFDAWATLYNVRVISAWSSEQTKCIVMSYEIFACVQETTFCSQEYRMYCHIKPWVILHWPNFVTTYLSMDTLFMLNRAMPYTGLPPQYLRFTCDFWSVCWSSCFWTPHQWIALSLIHAISFLGGFMKEKQFPKKTALFYGPKGQTYLSMSRDYIGHVLPSYHKRTGVFKKIRSKYVTHRTSSRFYTSHHTVLTSH